MELTPIPGVTKCLYFASQVLNAIRHAWIMHEKENQSSNAPGITSNLEPSGELDIPCPAWSLRKLP